jgi:two-component system invasion response regulator UvrY
LRTDDQTGITRVSPSDGLDAESEVAADATALPSEVRLKLNCECDSPDCREIVSVSAATYEALRGANHPVLAPGHRLGRAEQARRRAAATEEETRAVTSQAVQQQRRARRNIVAARLECPGGVLVVDDSEVFQQVGASLVSEAHGLRLVGVAACGEEAIQLLPELKPDLVLLDVHMPGLGGLETARIIRRESPTTVVILVSADPGSVAADAPSTGAAAFLSKSDLTPRTLDELWLEHLPRV